MVNVAEENKFYFSDHKRLLHPAHCQKKDCTGVYNVIIDDESGKFDADGV